MSNRSRAIGKDNQLLWSIPEDLIHFKKLTLNHTVIMGRKTWESIPEKFRPLPNRQNIVITRDEKYIAPGALIANSIQEGLEKAKETEGTEIFIIGGGEIYKQSMPYVKKLYLTIVESEVEGDTFFPEYEEFKVINRQKCKSGELSYEWTTLIKAT